MILTPAPSIDVLYQFEEYLEIFLRSVFKDRGFDHVYTMRDDNGVKMQMPRLCIATAARDSEDEDIFIHPQSGLHYYQTAAVDVDLILLTSRREQPAHRAMKGKVREIMQRVIYLSNESPEMPYHRLVRCVSQKPSHDLDPELERDTTLMPYQIIMQIRPEVWPAEIPL
ncbi:hypothetical protein DB346_08165 [Verrucomicrobia bacterium LW23]|nr:hypothetical protein DB346_08165 [Verrucomicrobia bacterium LW23]